MRINQPIDPVIRRRVRITGNSPVITKLLFILIFIAIICSGIYIYSGIPRMSNQDDSLNKLTVNNKVLDNPIDSIQGINPADISEKLLKGYSEVKSSQIDVTPTLPAKLDIKPLVKPVIVDAKQIINLATLLDKANKQIAMKRLTSPKGNNAYETYQIILEKSPQQAQKILDNIVAWYFTQGEKFIGKNRLTTKFKGRGSAYKMYQKIEIIAPNHRDTKNLLNSIITKLDGRAKTQLSNDKLINNAYITYQEMFKVAPNNIKTKRLLTNITNNLFTKAKKQITKQQYSTPKNNNAVDTFKHILAIAPGNIKAKKGLKKIAKKYYRLALRKYNQGRYKRSMTWLERGLQVSYNDPELNDLKQQVSEKLK